VVEAVCGPTGIATLARLAMDIVGKAGLVAEDGEFRRVASNLYLFTRAGHHLRRVQRDPAQHHRRAGTRPTSRGQGLMRPCYRPEKRIEGHGLLNGKVGRCDSRGQAPGSGPQ